MNKKIFLVAKIVTIIIMVLAIILQGMIMFGDDSDLSTGATLENYFKLAYFSLGLAVVLSIIFFIVNLFNYTMAQLLRLIAIVVFFGIVYLISSAMADGGNLPASFMEANGINYSTSKMIGSALIFSYIMLGLSILSIVVSTIVNAFK